MYEVTIAKKKGKRYAVFECPICGKVNRYLYDHFRTAVCSGGGIYCKHCGIEVTSRIHYSHVVRCKKRKT